MRFTPKELRSMAAVLEAWDRIPALDGAFAEVRDDVANVVFYISHDAAGEPVFETPEVP